MFCLKITNNSKHSFFSQKHIKKGTQVVPFSWWVGKSYCSFTSTLIEVQVTTPPVNPEMIKSVNLILVVT